MFTASKKLNIDFCLTEFSAKNIVSWKCEVVNKTNSRYDMIIGRDPLTALGLDLKLSENIIIGGDRSYKGCSAPMVYEAITNLNP